MIKKILYSTFARIFIGIAVCTGILAAGQAIMKMILGRTPLTQQSKDLITAFIVTALVLVAYITLYRFYEKRKITELSTRGLAKNLLIGILLGAILQSLTIYVIYLNHGFSVISVNKLVYILPALGISFGAAIAEEIIFRGIIFRIIEERLGSYYALAISAFIFGAAHFANPNSSVITALGIAIQAGLLLGAAYIYSKNLWFPIAIHFAWDFTQSGIFGATMSGNTIGKSLLETRIQGPAMISGGAWGPEGSIQATVFCLIAAVLLMVINHKQHKIVMPYWKRA